MSIINISDKIKLENGYEYRLIEKNFLNSDSEDNKDFKNSPGITIKIGTIRRPVSIATILLTKEDDYVGHISANLYNNGIASLIRAGIMGIDLPDELKKYGDIIQEHDTALLVDNKYRRKGRATKLLMLMFQYLDEKGIKDLEVCGITNESAMQTYLKTGAEILEGKNAIYRNIKRFLPKEKDGGGER